MTGWEDMKNDKRVGKAFANDNFGIVDINWLAEPHATINLSLVADDGAEVFNHKISLGDLR